MQNNKLFLFLFLVICLAPAFALADVTATLKYRANISGVAITMKASYSGRYMTGCDIRMLATGVGSDQREFLVTYTREQRMHDAENIGEVKTAFVFVFMDNDGGAIQKLRVEEVVITSPGKCTITRASQGGEYQEKAKVNEVRTQNLELLGRMLVSWARGNSDFHSSYRFEDELRELGLQAYLKEFAETPFEAYLGSK